jgi:two-component system, NarL family, response regulator NreC
MSSRTSIILADDHHVVRQGLRALLEASPDLIVIGEAADGATAVEMTMRLTPDVLILDLVMPGNGLEALRQVTQQAPRTRVVVLSMHSSEAYVIEALKGGASAYVVKDATASDLVRAVREVAAGRRYLSPPLSERAIDAYASRALAATVEPHEPLTAREAEVLRLAVRGHTVQQIALELSISPRTVETHRANFMRKLGLHSQTEVVRYAVRHGILLADA